ncbi:unnamed protein product [Ilex paraguariensis]|uniref:Uncharacterized protein n=1 Tax=Ilex paraguariensis TaxID=185542 RepID=A0ABC8UJ59_9AQUA
MMEEQKLQYLNELLKRRNESVDKYVEAMKSWEELTRDSYADPIKLNMDKFLEIMLLDGCFIIELFLKFEDSTLREHTTPFSKFLRFGKNQIPFSVLIHLFHMTGDSNQGNPLHILGPLALKFFRPTISNFARSPPSYNHLLGLVHYAWYSSIAGNGPFLVIDTNHQFIKSVTELREARIKFQKTESSSFLDVKFENGIMKIPSLVVDDDTECLFRNLIAYEQYGGGFVQTNMTDYTTFMDRLINSPKNVEILRHSGR